MCRRPTEVCINGRNVARKHRAVIWVGRTAIASAITLNNARGDKASLPIYRGASLELEDLQHFVAVVVDDLDSDLACDWLRKRTADGAVET